MKIVPFSIALTSLALAASLIACTGGTPTPVTPASVSPVPDSSAAPSLAPGVTFQDRFDGNALNEASWKVDQQSGLVVVKDGRLEILNAGRAKNFPYVVTRHQIIPEAGGFYFELGYEVMALAEYGFSLCLDYVPPEAPGEPGLTTPFLHVYQRNGDLLLSFQTEAAKPTVYTVTQAATPGKAHRLRLEYDGKEAYHALLDDQVVASFSSKRRPQKFWVGTYPLQDFKEGFWPRIAFDDLTVGSLTTFRTPQDATATPAPEATSAG